MNFASDNCAAVHPDVMQAIVKSNQGHATPYGDDAAMDRVRDRMRRIFEAPGAAVYLVATGSAANALALATLVQPWQTIYCHRAAHIETDECGAPEFFTGGARLTLLDGADGKISPCTLRRAISATPHGDVHSVQRGAVSITNSTEAGTIYTPDEVAEISAVVKQHDLALHMDGARFSNALAFAGCSAAELSWKSGVDVLSFGGTKNGLMGVEAVVMFDPARAWEFELRRKRAGHLLSKHRYLSVQIEASLQGDLWLDMARGANAMAARLAGGLSSIAGVEIAHPVQANMVFARMSRAQHRRAYASGAVYHLIPVDAPLEGNDDDDLLSRLVCSWSTSAQEVDRFLELIRT
ncbi:MAG: low specificity L-threonine aldolase [Paracoccaceae bacterium]